MLLNCSVPFCAGQISIKSPNRETFTPLCSLFFSHNLPLVSGRLPRRQRADTRPADREVTKLILGLSNEIPQSSLAPPLSTEVINGAISVSRYETRKTSTTKSKNLTSTSGWNQEEERWTESFTFDLHHCRSMWAGPAVHHLKLQELQTHNFLSVSVRLTDSE